MPRLHLSFLGAFTVTLDDQPVRAFRSVNVQALLAYLALESGQPHQRSMLAALFWPDEPERVARQNLRQSLYYLRLLLDGGEALSPVSPSSPERRSALPFLLITRQTVQFNPQSDHWLDVAEFLACLEQDRLERAAELYRGELLAGLFVASVAFEEWLVVTRERLHRLALDGLYRLAQRGLERGDAALAQRYARQQLALEPWREEAYRQLMWALAADGQRSAALAQYEVCRRVLAAEFGVEPAPETTALCEQIRAAEGAIRFADLQPAGLQSSRIPAISSKGTRVAGSRLATNIPSPPTPFIGRERELAEIQERLADADCRLLTLVGAGGIGKTRLAVQVARQQAEAGGFRDGVGFVALGGVAALAPTSGATTGDLEQTIAATIAGALNFTFSDKQPPKIQLLNLLRDTQLLLVLDNLEHLRDGVLLVSELLAAAPGLKVLATSREPLDLQEEWLYPVDGLEIPEDETDPDPSRYSSVRLFVQQARRIQPAFALDETNRPAVARICRYVEGVPLALELAASWLRGLTCAEIVAEMERLDFFTTPLRNQPDRHRSLRAVFDHSWRLLSPREQMVLARLSVFRGGFQREAAQAVARATIVDLTALAAKSLLRRTSSGRYEVHELLRQFAAEKLAHQPRRLTVDEPPGEKSETETAIFNQHSDYYLGFVSDRELALQGPQPGEAQAEIQQDLDNIRQAWKWAVGRDRFTALEQAIEGLSVFYRRFGLLREAETVFATAAEAVRRRLAERSGTRQNLERVLARLLIARGEFLLAGAQFEPALRMIEEAVELARACQARRLEAVGCEQWSRALLICGRPKEALAKYEQALSLARALSDRRLEALCLNGLGRSLLSWGNVEKAIAWHERALHLFRELGDRGGEAWTLRCLGTAFTDLGRLAQASRCYQESAAIAREIGDRRTETVILQHLAVIADRQGEYGTARAYCERVLQLARAMGDRDMELTIQINLSISADYVGDYEGAMSYARQALRIARDAGARERETVVLANLALHAHHLGDNEGAREYSQQALQLAQKEGIRTLEAYALDFLGHALLELGDPEGAAHAYREALALRQTLDQPHMAVESRAGLARVALAQGDLAEARGQVEEIIAYLREHEVLEGPEEPLRVYQTVYQVLKVALQHDCALEILERAHTLLRERAAKITDEPMRRSFLENVAAHREIAAEWAALTTR